MMICAWSSQDRLRPTRLQGADSEGGNYLIPLGIIKRDWILYWYLLVLLLLCGTGLLLAILHISITITVAIAVLGKSS